MFVEDVYVGLVARGVYGEGGCGVGWAARGCQHEASYHQRRHEAYNRRRYRASRLRGGYTSHPPGKKTSVLTFLHQRKLALAEHLSGVDPVLHRFYLLLATLSVLFSVCMVWETPCSHCTL